MLRHCPHAVAESTRSPEFRKTEAINRQRHHAESRFCPAQVQSAWEVEGVLKAIPKDVLEGKLRMVHEHGTRFAFLQKLTAPPNAVNSLLAGLCLKQKPRSPPVATVMPRFPVAI